MTIGEAIVAVADKMQASMDAGNAADRLDPVCNTPIFADLPLTPLGRYGPYSREQVLGCTDAFGIMRILRAIGEEVDREKKPESVVEDALRELVNKISSRQEPETRICSGELCEVLLDLADQIRKVSFTETKRPA